MQPKIGIGILALNENQVLMGKRKKTYGKGTWAFPGGHLEFGETAIQCARRELFEETNLTAIQLHLGPWIEVVEEENHFITIFVLVTSFTGKLTNTEPDKTEDWQWVFVDTLPTPLFSPIKQLIPGQSLAPFLAKNSPLMIQSSDYDQIPFNPPPIYDTPNSN